MAAIQAELTRPPKTMTPTDLSQALSDLAKKADATPLRSTDRAAVLREIGDLLAVEGYVAVAQTWYASADSCDS